MSVKVVFENGEVDKATPRETRAWLRNHGLTVKNAKKDSLEGNSIWTFEGVQVPVEKVKAPKETPAVEGEKKSKKSAPAAEPAKGGSKAKAAPPKGKSSKAQDWEEDDDGDDDFDDDDDE